MKVIVSVKNRDELEKIKKIINKDIEIRYADKNEGKIRLSSLSGIVLIGGDSIKEMV